MITLLLAVVVLVPEKPGPVWWEIERLTPDVELRPYDERAAVVTRGSEDVMVIYADHAPEQARKRRVLALAKSERRLVFVFTKDLENYLRVPRGGPEYARAIGRVIAHELEHVRRQSREHDRDGLFQACLGRDELLAVGWGTR